MEKLEKRQRISEKLKDQLYDFQKEINELKGVNTINRLIVLVEKDDWNEMNNKYIGIVNGVFGLYFEYPLFNQENPEKSVEYIDEYVQNIGIKTIFKGLYEFFEKLEQLSDFSEYDENLQKLINK